MARAAAEAASVRVRGERGGGGRSGPPWRRTLEVFAVQHENRWIATVSESEGCSGARFSSRGSGPAGRKGA